MAGQAIEFMYRFLKERAPNYESVIEKDIGKEEFEKFEVSTKKKILNYGCQKKDEICQSVVDLFLDMLSTIVGDYICYSLPFGGLYIVSGIINTVAEYILENPQERFLKNYI